ncbi:hypothetical protein D1220_20655 [Klebsiella pneumoniae]|nr:hypothetical protein D1220_20655 [Klebsiella pneumoniae]
MSCKYMHDAALLEFHSLISLHKAIDGLIVVYNGYGGNDSNLLIVFYVQIMPDDLVMQLHRF